MQGRIKRKLEQRELETLGHKTEALPTCALCNRPLGTRVEYHHVVPKSEGGTTTVAVHPICHRAIHAHVSNHDLAEMYSNLDALRQRNDMQRFLKWIAKKPANFHAPTRRNRDK